MHGSHKCCHNLVELTVDDILQIGDVGDQELRRLAHSSRRGTIELGAGENDGACTFACPFPPLLLEVGPFQLGGWGAL